MSDKITKLWDDERERIKNAVNDEEVEELSKPSIDERIEELERDYDRFNRAAEANAGGKSWGRMAEETRDELVNLKTDKLEELANRHDSMSHDDFIGADRVKKRLYSDFQVLKGEVEELQAARDR